MVLVDLLLISIAQLFAGVLCICALLLFCLMPHVCFAAEASPTGRQVHGEFAAILSTTASNASASKTVELACNDVKSETHTCKYVRTHMTKKRDSELLVA